ncbi:MAG: Unknown protein [uncultured Campylobacterales bacterium]|uniref:DUF1439 domain-containing protein n=1 Tax=uncultured Campylobacterales bacterium TaxID=352960 RepID=A0A6S6SM50_9BACT|nr:MAG: Unknown protein [uncultured Campylobacterales bacterium]
MRKVSILFLIGLFLNGCVGINENGLSLRIPAASVIANITNQFPVSKSTSYGDVKISNPNLLFNESDAVSLGSELAFDNPLLSKLSAKLNVSGNVVYDQAKKSFFIQNAIVDSLEFNKNSLLSSFSGISSSALKPIIQNLISQIPIYTLDDPKYRYIKNATVNNGNIDLTFGL